MWVAKRPMKSPAHSRQMSANAQTSGPRFVGGLGSLFSDLGLPSPPFLGPPWDPLGRGLAGFKPRPHWEKPEPSALRPVNRPYPGAPLTKEFGDFLGQADR